MSYLHHVPGRLRVRIAGIKHNPARAAALKSWVQRVKGVDRVDINTLTGSVLIYYRQAETCAPRLLARLRANAWLPAASGSTETGSGSAPSRRIERAFAKAVVGYLAQTAIERSLIAIASAVL